MSREIRRKLDQGRGEAARAMDVLRQSFEHCADEHRQAKERIKQRHAERVRNYWQEANDNRKES